MKLAPLLLAAALAVTPAVAGAQATSPATSGSGGTTAGSPNPGVEVQPATTNPVATAPRTPPAAQPQQQQPTVIPGVETPAAPGQGPAAMPAPSPAETSPALPVIRPFANAGLPDGPMGLKTQVTDIGRDAA